MSQSIAYQDRPAFLGDGSAPVWLAGTLTPVAGGYTVVKPNAQVLSVQPNGAYQERPPGTAGPWETCQPATGINALLYTIESVTYAVIYRGV